MKKYFKRITSVALCAVIMSCSAVCLGTNAAAAEDSGVAENSVVIESPIGDDISLGDDEATAPYEESTEPQETTQAATELTTEPVETAPIATEPSTTPTEATTVATEPSTAPTKPAPTVGKVSNIVKTGGGTDTIDLAWDKTKGASGYVVYYCNADKSKTYKRLAYVKSNKYTVKNLSHTTSYYFRIAAYVEQDGKKYVGTTTLKRTATYPATPKLTKKRSSSVLEFSWGRNANATGYKIYRASGKTNGKYVLYKTITNNKTTSFSDKNVELGRAYNYRVRAYRCLYTNSTYMSKNGEIKFIAGLSSPDFTAKSQLSRVSLTWSKNKYATGYDIYYATSKDGPFKYITSTKNDYYNTNHLTNGKTYYFRVRPYKISGAKKTKVVGTYLTKAKKVSNKGYGVDVGNTYIEISTKQQHMWFYVNGKLYCHTDVVTGNDDGYHNTTKGTFKIFQRQSPATLVGADYVSYVKYWLGFTTSGIGIHDASWRSSGEYGGNTYKGNGSHGCVNTPYNAVKKIYQKAKIGTYVVVY